MESFLVLPLILYCYGYMAMDITKPGTSTTFDFAVSLHFCGPNFRFWMPDTFDNITSNTTQKC